MHGFCWRGVQVMPYIKPTNKTKKGMIQLRKRSVRLADAALLLLLYTRSRSTKVERVAVTGGTPSPLRFVHNFTEPRPTVSLSLLSASVHFFMTLGRSLAPSSLCVRNSLKLLFIISSTDLTANRITISCCAHLLGGVGHINTPRNTNGTLCGK